VPCVCVRGFCDERASCSARKRAEATEERRAVITEQASEWVSAFKEWSPRSMSGDCGMAVSGVLQIWGRFNRAVWSAVCITSDWALELFCRIDLKVSVRVAESVHFVDLGVVEMAIGERELEDGSGMQNPGRRVKITVWSPEKTPGMLKVAHGGEG